MLHSWNISIGILKNVMNSGASVAHRQPDCYDCPQREALQLYSVQGGRVKREEHIALSVSSNESKQIELSGGNNRTDRKD